MCRGYKNENINWIINFTTKGSVYYKINKNTKSNWKKNIQFQRDQYFYNPLINLLRYSQPLSDKIKSINLHLQYMKSISFRITTLSIRKHQISIVIHPPLQVLTLETSILAFLYVHMYIRRAGGGVCEVCNTHRRCKKRRLCDEPKRS